MTRFLSITKVAETQKNILLERNLTDFMKFIACVLVAMSHYSGYVLANDVSSAVAYKVIVATGGYLGVAVFFFLSGYGLMISDLKNHLGFWDFIRRRLKKTYLPAVLVSAIWLGIAATSSLDLLCNQNYFMGVIWRFNDEVMWFVRAIIVMYVFFWLYSTVTLSIVDKTLWLFLLLLAFAATAYSVIRIWGGEIASLSVPLFFLGMAVAKFPQYIRKILCNTWIVGVLTLMTLCLLWVFRHDNQMLHGWGNYVAIGILLLILVRYNIRILYLPHWVGSCSYDVYLVHYKVHLLILYFMPVDVLWMFVGGTTMTTAIFYRIRRLLHV